MANPIPNSIEILVNNVWAEMQADPKHQLPHQRRREIYAALRANTDQRGPNVLGWLAVVTAKRVLPIFQEAFPEDTLPQELLDTAVGVLRGQVDSDRADEMQDLGYHASGNAWGYDEDEMPWTADMAGAAAYHALLEACGHEPLQHLDKTFVLGTVDMGSGGMTECPEPIQGEQFTDEELCTDSNSDTAAPAAVASSCSDEGPWCDPERHGAFWTWWLKEAIPEAWEKAHEARIA